MAQVGEAAKAIQSFESENNVGLTARAILEVGLDSLARKKNAEKTAAPEPQTEEPAALVEEEAAPPSKAKFELPKFEGGKMKFEGGKMELPKFEMPKMENPFGRDQ